MNKINCNVIGDLLPLYVDGAVSEDTKKLVEEHLAECEECKKAAEDMGKELVLPVHETVAAAETSFLQKMKKNWTKRKILTAVISVLVTAGVIFGGALALTGPEIVIPYDPEIISVEVENDRVYVCYDGKEHLSTLWFEGENGRYIYFIHNPWTAYIKPLFSFGKGMEHYRIDVGPLEEVPMVAYGEFGKGLGYVVGKEDRFLENSQIIWTRDEVMP